MPGPGAKQSPTDNLNLLLEMARSSFTSVPSPFRGLSCRFLHVRAKSKVGWSCLFCSLSLRHLPQASHLGGGGALYCSCCCFEIVLCIPGSNLLYSAKAGLELLMSPHPHNSQVLELQVYVTISGSKNNTLYQRIILGARVRLTGSFTENIFVEHKASYEVLRKLILAMASQTSSLMTAYVQMVIDRAPAS